MQSHVRADGFGVAQQGVSQEQLERDLPHLPVATIAQCLNVLSIKVRMRCEMSYTGVVADCLCLDVLVACAE